MHCVLLISHSLLALNCVEELLGKKQVPISDHSTTIQYSADKWEKNVNYLSEPSTIRNMSLLTSVCFRTRW